MTGTNGKTLTTSLIVKVLKKKYKEVLTNPTGSNMLQGITTAFLAQPKRGHGRGIAVLEVDEANVAPVAAQLKPKAFVLTNIFRDQMDRYGEFYTTYQKILDGVIRFSAPESCLIQSPTMALNSRQMAIIKPRRIRTVSYVRYVSTFCTTMHKLTPIWAIIFVRIAASNAPL
ncbi:UDP-N-acetylmuramyl tripeptide synthase [Mycobacteroides abscessus subsp. abscessus]|nr:UDP-N-acetylmuramyl tripeptide synthase [Mycobacteroides abscessus subsp. abscessus]